MTCIHAKLQLQLVVPEECFERGALCGWYICEQCGEEFNTNLKPYKLKVFRGEAVEKGGV